MSLPVFGFLSCTGLAALGGRIRYLVDTPEVIWGCLDTGRLLDGAVRLLRAREVHRRLRTERQGAEVAARFPLLVPLWPGVEKFRCDPSQRLRCGSATWLWLCDMAVALLL